MYCLLHGHLWKWLTLTKILSIEIDISLSLTQLRKSDVLRKVTEMISFKKMAKGFIATWDDPWVGSALRNC